jgi:predicted YcjX-like family ATPase
MLNWFKKLFRKKIDKRLIDDYDFNSVRQEKESELNRILDKISEKGIKNLTKQEQKFLKNNK